MSDNERSFPAGNGQGAIGTGRGAKHDGVNYGAALRALADKAEPIDAELLRAAADRVDNLLDETDRLLMQLNGVAERLGQILYGSVWSAQGLIDVAAQAPTERGGA